ncbi:MAG: hypothetical protein QG657_4200 [Acidobacteriota bacterium]|nr:hypothetical protein [Acidobacteriota bacterium]
MNYLHTAGEIFESTGKYPDFLAIISEYGYEAARIEHGQELFNEFAKYHYAYLEKRQDALSKLQTLRTLYKNIFKEYMDYVKRLRVELVNDAETSAALGLRGERDRAKGVFLDQSTNFYTMAMKPEIFGKIQGFGLTMEKLQNSGNHVREYLDYRIAYESMDGECQELVEKRSKAYTKSREWLTAFVTSCKVAYAGNLQALEKFGIFILNRPRKHRVNETPETESAPDKPVKSKKKRRKTAVKE